MQREWGAVTRGTIAAFCLVVLMGCSGGSSDAPAEPVPEPEPLTEEDVTRARQLYDENACATCHGDDAEGNDLGPELRDLTPWWDEEKLTWYLGAPEEFVAEHPDFEKRRETVYDMPMLEYSHVPVFDRRLMARWLLTL